MSLDSMPYEIQVEIFRNLPDCAQPRAKVAHFPICRATRQAERQITFQTCALRQTHHIDKFASLLQDVPSLALIVRKLYFTGAADDGSCEVMKSVLAKTSNLRSLLIGLSIDQCDVYFEYACLPYLEELWLRDPPFASVSLSTSVEDIHMLEQALRPGEILLQSQSEERLPNLQHILLTGQCMSSAMVLLAGCSHLRKLTVYSIEIAELILVLEAFAHTLERLNIGILYGRSDARPSKTYFPEMPRLVHLSVSFQIQLDESEMLKQLPTKLETLKIAHLKKTEANRLRRLLQNHAWLPALRKLCIGMDGTADLESIASNFQRDLASLSYRQHIICRIDHTWVICD